MQNRFKKITHILASISPSALRALALAAIIFFIVTGIVSAAGMEPIRLSSDRKGFIQGASGRAFTTYGFNYAPRNEMLEDHWDTHWSEIEGDFREMKDLGANVVRIHLQYPVFMEAVDRPSTHALSKMRDILTLAERTGLYLDITGLAAYKPNSTAKWYDDLYENARWDAQANFWSAIAETCTSSPAVFCYNLMNEPIVPGEKRDAGKWYSGALFGGFDFVQFVALDPAGRPREQVARDWIKRLVPAIRRHDTSHLVTVGLLPWDRKHQHLSGFLPQTVAPELNFLSVHIYPATGKLDEAIEGLRQFQVGKPLVIEELFPLYCGAEDLKKFMLESKGTASGWIGHYFGETEADLKEKLAVKDSPTSGGDMLMLAWQQTFREAGPDLITSGTGTR